LVSGSDDGTIRFWSSETGEPELVLNPSIRGIDSLAISPDGRWIASGSNNDDGNVRLWDMVSGSPGPVLQGHIELVNGITFSPDGQFIATSGMDHRVILWDASTGDVISTFDGHSENVWAVAFSPDGRTIASGSYDETVRLWEVNSSRSSIAIQDQIGESLQVAYSPDGLYVLSVDRPGVIRQGDATTGLRGSVSFELPELQSICSLAFSLDGDQIAIGCGDESVRLWDRSTGAAGPVLEGHSSPVRILAFSICGRWIASSDDDRIVRLWDLHDTEQQCVIIDVGANGNNYIGDLKFSPTGHQLAVCSWGGIVWFFDPRTRVLLSFKELKEEGILALDYSPNGQELALGTETLIALWDMLSDEPHLELNVPPTSSQYIYGNRVSITYSPCGQFLASTGADCILHLWQRQTAEGDTDSWYYALALRACHGFIEHISWNPVVPTEFITAGLDGSVRLWRILSSDGTVAAQMLWGTNIRTLCTADVVLEGATGLSLIHRKLLVQGGAIDNGVSSGGGDSNKDE
ncbi:hypothetical protein BGZ88_012428, partial [Linnemannia elongata]